MERVARTIVCWHFHTKLASHLAETSSTSIIFRAMARLLSREASFNLVKSRSAWPRYLGYKPLHTKSCPGVPGALARLDGKLGKQE